VYWYTYTQVRARACVCIVVVVATRGFVYSVIRLGVTTSETVKTTLFWTWYPDQKYTN